MNMFQKLLSNLIIKNVKTDRPSYTLTLVIVGFFIINLKLLFSGMELTHHIKFDSFSGVDYAASLAAIGALHIGNKKIVRDSEGKE